MSEKMLLWLSVEDADLIREEARKDRRTIGNFVTVAVEDYIKNKVRAQDE